jgi:hypothetical protein
LIRRNIVKKYERKNPHTNGIWRSAEGTGPVKRCSYHLKQSEEDKGRGAHSSQKSKETRHLNGVEMNNQGSTAC